MVGMALGDGYLNVAKRTNKNGNTWTRSELRVLHGPSQKDYCYYKAGLLKKYTGKKFNVTQVANGPGGKYQSYQFVSSHPYFKTLKGWLYPGGEKVISRKILEMLSPLGISIWYMDDGHARTNANRDGVITSASTEISTMCSLNEVKDIVCYFNDNHGINFNIRYDKRQSSGHKYYIQCNTEESRKFVNLVSDYIIPSMRYKIDHVKSLDSHERLAPISSCTQCFRPIYQKRRTGLCSACYSKKLRKVAGKKLAMI